MINSSQLNKLILKTLFFSILIFNVGYADTAVDIWKKQENKKKLNDQINTEEIIIKSPILSEENIQLENISELEIDQHEQTVIGLFDPEDNNFDLGMWLDTDGSDIKNVFKRIDKLKLSEFSEDLLFKVLFTNAYPPRKNLTSTEFLKIKIDWLIKHRRLEDLENLLLTNPAAGK